jgi:hypothetical protein
MLKQTQSFNDGIANIYKVGDVALPGDMPKEGLVFQQTLRYHERTVGLGRYYAALQKNIKVDFVIRCPEVRGLSDKDTDILVATLNGGSQYEIKQIQYPEDVEPPVMDLTLERIGEPYGTN